MKKKQPTFTIVTVSFNCKTTIEKTILSVLQQDFTDYEYIVIDGGSTDGTTDIIRKYESRLAYWCSESDKGIYDGMNKGVKESSGEWIVFMNAGDVMHSSKTLNTVYKYAQTSSQDILYGDILTERNGTLCLKKALEPCNKQRMFFCHQSGYTRTQILREHPFDLRFKLSADFYFFKYCYQKGYHFTHIPEPLTIYDRNGVSNTHRLVGLYDNVRVIKELDKGFEKFKLLTKLYFVIYWNKLRKKLR